LENIMKKSTRYVAPFLAAFAIGGELALTPIANADTDSAPVATSEPPFGTGPSPLVPYGSMPYIPYQIGHTYSNHDEVYTTNGYRDLPF
jgi:hypothetical protein